MDIRNKRQEEFAEVYLKGGPRGILNLCPRFGKSSVGVRILQGIGKFPKVLIAYPHKKIEGVWKKEIKRLKYKNPFVTFTTHLSLKKYVENHYDIVIIDEIHLLSEAQIKVVEEMQKRVKRILGLTGTLSIYTERNLKKELKLDVIGVYTIEDAVREGIVKDYQITVKLVPLDDKVQNQYKTAKRTEKEQFTAYGKVIEKLEAQGKETFFLRLARVRIIQNSLAKIEATKDLLGKLSRERVLVFCGLIKTAENLGCPVFHSKSKDSKIFDDFSTGKGKHMAVVKIGNTGVTYKPLEKVVVNYFDSNSENLAQKLNRCMSMEYNNPGSKADIWIISSDEEVELKWLKRALEFFDQKKIKYIK